MKTNTTDLLTLIDSRLSTEKERLAAEMERVGVTFDNRSLIRPAEGIGDLKVAPGNAGALKLPPLDGACSTCAGHGFLENEERAEVDHYFVINRDRDGNKIDQRMVDGPKTKVRAVCARCTGRGRELYVQGAELLANLARILRDEIHSEAANVDQHNARARAQLAAQAKEHEAARARHEEAQRVETEAAERAAAIRAGRTPPAGR